MKLNVFDKRPLYMKIRDNMKELIESGYWKEGALIPTEKELVSSYGVSRVTIRSAISYLVNENYLVRVAGYGTTVLSSKPNLQNFTLIQSFTNEMKEMGIPCETIKAEVAEVKATKKLAKIFGCSEDCLLTNLRRVRGSEKPILFSDTYLLPTIKIPNEEKILTGSLYSYLATKEIFFSKFDEYVSAVMITDELKGLLEIEDDEPVLKRKRFSYDSNNNLVEYTETFYNSKQYEYRTRLIYRK
ncbi:MAG: GntR family transcriptional regulator [Tenericutes bacterium]|nr:GntR family transcriptional regulator [Mycoplasmatota bacterium]